jgi:hypothetical protein
LEIDRSLAEICTVNAQQIMRRRHWALTIIRILALAMILYGGLHILWGLGASFGLADLNVLSGIRSTLTIFWNNNRNPFWFGLAVLLPGAALVMFDRRLARWLVPLPLNECPQCGYGLQRLTTRRCPECGYQIQTDQSQAE